MKKVLLATRPLVPPWDEASKNFAYFLGREITDHSLTLLTTDTGLAGLPASASQEPVYTSSVFDLSEKIYLLNYLYRVRQQFDITHYLFTPTRWNSFFLKTVARPRRGKTIQTVATVRDDLYDEETLKEMLFADALVTYTDATKHKLEAMGKTNITRIYPGIDLSRFSPQPKFKGLLDALGLNEKHFVVMYPGEYTRLGATDFLMHTFIDYFENNPDTDLRFLFACRVKNSLDARKKEEVRAAFEQAGVASFIRFTDTIADMPALYNLADIVLFPVENLAGKFDVPLIIIESYACEKPVIVTDLPAFREFTHPDFSVIIPRSSTFELLRAITELKNSPEKRLALGKKARQFVETSFNLKNTAAAYSRLYTEL